MTFINQLFSNSLSSSINEINKISHIFSQDIQHLKSETSHFDLHFIKSEPVKSKIHFNDDLKFTAPISLRYLSLIQFSFEGAQADYVLAFEINAPPSSQLDKNYKVPFSPSLNWVLSKGSTPSRLNAWKESNIIYRQIQQA
ncbi:hypothetical protein JQC92_17715 [Shewanella sp. 202IG2-18]|uniref:hypothetical protein n=1 Tax=Parashewanella hymeniacidonis TaxID=2807618 RepID=UPI001961A08A|nr:hypothetical protein [Parashewanella hymeniacidonis]MBM7073848.1 hypothetical protein [Parashewanella hymeniacidonis]